MKKLFLLLTAVILSAGMWAESVTFTTYKQYTPVSPGWTDAQQTTEQNNLKANCAVQSDPYVKIDTKDPYVRVEWGRLAVTGTFIPGMGTGMNEAFNYYLWLNTSQVEVTLLDTHAVIESIKVTYTDDSKQTQSGLVISSSTFTMPFPAGQTSHLFTFAQGTIRVMRITVNYHLTTINNVSYIDADGNAQIANNVTKITNTSSTLDAGWYVVNGEVSTAGLVCNGDVRLILADGAKLTAIGNYGEAGIRVSGAGNSLTIYGQSGQTGKLSAKGGESAAGIGGGPNENGSNITINGGEVTANGGFYAAGIGGGDSGSASNITINGGKINATGVRSGAAGIGGGQNGGASNITINGGTVAATGASYAAGIGGGQSGSASNIRINGGKIAAEGGTNSNGDVFYSAIGAGASSTASNIYVSTSLLLKADNNNPPTTVINHVGDQDIATSLVYKHYAMIDGPITCTVTFDRQGGSNGTTEVAATYGAAMPQITLPTRGEDGFQGYFAEEDGLGTKYYNADGSSAHVCDFVEAKTLYAHWSQLSVDYIDADGSTKSVTNFTLITNASTALNAGWYVVYGADVRTGMLTCNGDVRLILADGAKLTAIGDDFQAGIQVTGSGNSLIVYGQQNQSGLLMANGGDWGAGIGSGAAWGEEDVVGSNITINGGKVTAHGGEDAAGIGGGLEGSASNITINGGEVTAIGGGSAVGIGAGMGRGSASYIYFNGGKVTVIGGSDMAVGSPFNETSDIHVDESLLLRVGFQNPPVRVIDCSDVSIMICELADNPYATIEPGAVVVTHNAENMGANYGTYYNGTHVYEVVTEGVTMYTASLETYGTETWLNLSEIEGNVLPANTPVIVKSTTVENIGLVEYTGSTDGITVPANSLSGTDVDLTVAANTVYTMAAEDKTLGFYMYSGTTIPAHKAYLELPAGIPAPRRIGFGSHISTDVENTEVVLVEKILHNGQLLIRKNGHLYNVQGLIVK